MNPGSSPRQPSLWASSLVFRVLRDKEHSTIIYESPQPDTPLLRLAWNKQVGRET